MNIGDEKVRLKTDESEKAFLAQYDPTVFDRPNNAVDSVIYTVFEGHLHVLLMKREHHPFQGYWSLIGGYVDLAHDETLEDTARRKLVEKTGVATPYLEQFYTFGGKDRDPRGWSVTTVYFALIPAQHIQLQAGFGAQETKWVALSEGGVTEKLAFDHSDILQKCTERLRKKVLYTSLPVHLMPPHFTLNELQDVYENIMGHKMDPKSFRRRLLSADILQETGEMKKTARRPAMLYALKQTDETYFFTRNIEAAPL